MLVFTKLVAAAGPLRGHRIWGLALVCLSALALPGNAQDQEVTPDFSEADLEFFEREIRPILSTHCQDCHGADEQEAGLRVDSRQGLLKGGDAGPALVPGHPETSRLLEVVRYEGEIQMPPDSKLPAEKIALLEKWVEMGAPWPRETLVGNEQPEAFDLAARLAAHWCWRPPQMPAVPNVSNADWARDPIDHFILQRLTAAGLEPAGDADKATLLRRLSFALVGLPPSPEQLQRFLADDRPEAWEKVVDELLASPHFGEHWARHWMDLIRYAETHGHEFDYPIVNAYHYRDYLIRAFNADVPYDLFVKEHLAGDLLAEPRRHPQRKFNESVLGTGFFFLGEATHGPVDVKEDEAGHIDNQIDVLGKTFLGLTIACARCHDHKFDAISTVDYYALSGFLQSSRRQTVLLDMDGKIEAGLNELAPLREDLDRAFSAWQDGVQQVDTVRFKKILTAAVELARSAPPAAASKVIWQGEKLKAEGDVKGVEVQRITPQGNFSWQGDEQLWWRDGKPGDKLAVVFDVPEAGTYSVAVNLTQARDYGIVKLWLDDSSDRAVTIDGYSPELTTTGSRELSRVPLTAGPHRLHVEIVGANQAAIPRHMFGLDVLELQRDGAEMLQANWAKQLQSLAQQLDLEPGDLSRLVDALRSGETQNPEHPVYGLHKVLTPEATVATGDQLRQEVAARDRVPEGSELVRFADFEPTDSPWLTTGWAFQGSTHPDVRASLDGKVARPGVLSSAQGGKKLHGSARSPTFEITHDRIHLRLRGENVQVRLIIDGYTLDHFNSLLFAGMTVQLPPTPNYGWLTLGGDIRNYHGHRAYLEINDLENGWCEVDQVCFGNGDPPRGTHPLTRHLAAELGSIDAARVAEACGNWLQAGENARDADWLDWIATHQLEFLIRSDWKNSWRESLAKFQQVSDQLPDPVQAIGMTDGSPENEFVFIRGNHKSKGPEVPRRTLAAFLDESRRYERLQGSGRLEFAEELVAPGHPLTSRVLVNRLWHHLFGRGLVDSVDNFGALGSTPTHPELLDYLALEFERDGWSLKKMLKRMVMTRTYTQASVPSARALQLDPKNDLLHSFRIRRLSGEEIRDSILATSGELDPAQFGPSVPIYLTEFMQGRGRPGSSGPLDGARRRSVYLEVRRNFLHPMMLAFDTPIPFNAIGRRNISNVPAQALILMNDPFVVDQAEKWARRLLADTDAPSPRMERLLVRALGRNPTAEEVELCRAWLAEESQRRTLSESAAAQDVELWRDLCHVVFNLKAFTYVE